MAGGRRALFSKPARGKMLYAAYFTINGLFLDPISGETFDYVGGVADLRNGIIRAIGDPSTRFREDHLRLLRAVRFAARFRFAIEPATFAAVRELAPAIQRVAAERVRDELLRILTEGGARYGFELLDASGLLHEILPEVEAMKGVEQPPEYHPEGDVWTHTLMMLDGLDQPTPALAMGVLLHDVGKPPTFRVADRIRFDGHVEEGLRLEATFCSGSVSQVATRRKILALVENHMKFKDAFRMRESTLKRFMRLPRFDEHLALHRLDCLNSNGNLEDVADDATAARRDATRGAEAATADYRSRSDCRRLRARTSIRTGFVGCGRCAARGSDCHSGRSDAIGAREWSGPHF